MDRSLIGGEAVPSVGAFVRVGQPTFKVFKEIKPELKEFKVEGKELVKELKELKLENAEIKRLPDIPDPKLIREGFDPFAEFTDPSPLIRLLAERVDNLEERLAQGRAFIRAKERPEVGAELLEEDAEALLAVREAAETAARETLPDQGEPYRPSPAEEIERGLGAAGEPPPQHGGHAHDNVPQDPGSPPEAEEHEPKSQAPK